MYVPSLCLPQFNSVSIGLSVSLFSLITIIVCIPDYLVVFVMIHVVSETDRLTCRDTMRDRQALFLSCFHQWSAS